MDYVQVKQEILTNLGWELPEVEYTQDELKELYRLSKTTPRLRDDFCEIPLSHSANGSRPTDPRFLDRMYRKTLYTVKPHGTFNYNNPLLTVRLLDIVLDLDWTMISAIHPQNQSKPLLDAEVAKYKTAYPGINFIPFILQSVNGFMILAIRPNLVSFLNKLQKLGQLYVYTSADREYATTVLRIIDQSTRFFGDRILAAGIKKEEAYLEKSLDLLNLSKDNVVIIDDQVDVWRRADQGCVIPSMRFAPCYQEEIEFRNNKAYSDRMRTYNYQKGVFGFKDDLVPFIETKGQQLDSIHNHI